VNVSFTKRHECPLHLSSTYFFAKRAQHTVTDGNIRQHFWDRPSDTDVRCERQVTASGQLPSEPSFHAPKVGFFLSLSYPLQSCGEGPRCLRRTTLPPSLFFVHPSISRANVYFISFHSCAPFILLSAPTPHTNHVPDT
jgi:hypothetical protein